MKKGTESRNKRKTVTKTLSLPKRTADIGEEMAAREIRNFSNYVAALIERDAKSGRETLAA